MDDLIKQLQKNYLAVILGVIILVVVVVVIAVSSDGDDDGDNDNVETTEVAQAVETDEPVVEETEAVETEEPVAEETEEPVAEETEAVETEEPVAEETEEPVAEETEVMETEEPVAEETEAMEVETEEPVAEETEAMEIETEEPTPEPTIEPTPDLPTKYTNIDRVSARECPEFTDECPVVTILRVNTAVIAIERQNGQRMQDNRRWWLVRYEDQQMYIHDTVLSDEPIE